MATRRLDIDAIERSLRDVQRDFSRINRIIKSKREDLSDDIVSNMLEGYTRIDYYLKRGKHLLTRKRRHEVLELNHIVLCGSTAAARREFKEHIEHTRDRFFFDPVFNIDMLLDWYLRHRKDDVWKLAAGWYTRQLSQPQLFFEGNHRTGALIMSYIMARRKQPPFVLSLDNAKGYFDPSSMIKRTHKSKGTLMFRLPGMGKKFAKFLKNHAEPRFLTKK